MSRNYSSTAAESALASGVSGSATLLQVSTVSGLPSVPFTLMVDPDTVSEEIVTVTGVAGTSLTVVRGEDGTSGVSHEVGAKIRHGVSARDLREPQQHIAAATGVHGVGGSSSVVGTGTSQTLSNKTLDSTNVVQAGALPSDTVYRTGVQTISDKVIDTSNTVRVSTPTASNHAVPRSYLDAAGIGDTGWIISSYDPVNYSATRMYRVKNGWGVFRISGSRTAGTDISNTDLHVFTLPESARPSQNAYGDAYVGSNVQRAYIFANGEVHLEPFTINGGNTFQAYITWPVG